MTPTFCTYFKRIEKFRYDSEKYAEWVAFCVKTGAFAYKIDGGKEERACEGQIVFCPPDCDFARRIIEPAEICMIKFNISDDFCLPGKRVSVSNALRFFDDLKHLESCLFCGDLASEPLFLHYCKDVLYLAAESARETTWADGVKRYLENNFECDVSISELARREGYTVPHLINKFKALCGVTPKAYLARVRLRRAKELLLSTSLLSREIAQATGFSDELYFIRFLKSTRE
ncbi:MAG: helix-turn-helix transcriptional regulator [Clostridia bacterium]|nr:helix-turn-helix transcriptional regulator [Clostridia bacterium]